MLPPLFSRLLFAVAAVVAVAGSLLAGAPASTGSSTGCHGSRVAPADDDVGCHGAKASQGCHGVAEAPEAGSGCHGRHRSTVADRRASRVAGRAEARADRAAARADRAASRAGCHGLKSAKAGPGGCHGAPGAPPAAPECDCDDGCDCR